MKKFIFCLVFIIGCCCNQTGEIVYKSGEMVQIKGGPKMMVVCDVYGTNPVTVEWTDHLGIRRRDSISQTQLKNE